MKQPSTLMEAYEQVMTVVGDLRESGIEVSLTPSVSRHEPEMVEKYSGLDCLKPCYWFHVTMEPADETQAKAIYEASVVLRKLGIGFDSGGGMGCRDWELDWSFHLRHVNSASLNSMSEGREVVEEFLKGDTERQ